MSDKKDNVIPPGEKLPNNSRELVKSSGAVAGILPLQDPGNDVLNQAWTGLQADLRARSFRKLATESRAKADYLDATGELAESYINANRSVSKLDELEDILKHDKLVRKENRREELAQARRAATYADIGRAATVKMKSRTIDLVNARKEGKIVEIMGGLPSTEPVKPADEGETILPALEAELEAALATGKDPDSLLAQIKERKAWLAEKEKSDSAT